jgi:tripartite-type tricarboxylate transporter receptor subunit TctC
MLAPAGTPPAVVARLNAEIAHVLKSPITQKQMSTQGAATVTMTPQQFGKHIASETAKWARVVKEAGIRSE